MGEEQTVRIGLTQTRQTVALADNSEAILWLLDDAAQAGVEVPCFPETQMIGYRVDIRRAREPVRVDVFDEFYPQVTQWCGRLGIEAILGTELPHPVGGDGAPLLLGDTVASDGLATALGQ